MVDKGVNGKKEKNQVPKRRLQHCFIDLNNSYVDKPGQFQATKFKL